MDRKLTVSSYSADRSKFIEGQSITLGEFLSANADSLDAEEIGDLRRAIAAGDEWTCGGGAQPIVIVKAA